MMQGDRKDMEMKDLYNNDNYSDGYYYITVTMKNALSAFSQLISTTTPWRTNIIPILQIIKLRHTSNMSKVTESKQRKWDLFQDLDSRAQALGHRFLPHTHPRNSIPRETKDRPDLQHFSDSLLLIQRKKALLKLSKITALPSFQLLPPTFNLLLTNLILPHIKRQAWKAK